MKGSSQQQNGPVCRQAGFTLIELLMVVGIIGILFTMATINLVRAQHTVSVSATVDQLVADLRTQQTKAMTGANDTTGNPNSYGVSFTVSGYKLFQGTSDPGDGTDFAVTPHGVTFSTNLPGNMIDFAQRSGEMCSNACGPYAVTVKNANGTEQRVLTVNKYGVVTDNQLE